jgi:hypothetical protein
MASELFNTLSGYSVGIPAVEVIDSSGNVVTNVFTSGNVKAENIYTDHYFFSNGAPLKIGAGGTFTQLQFNNNGAFDGIPNVTWNGSYLNLGNISDIRISGGVNGYVLQTDGEGNLAWTAQTGGGGNGGTPGGSNTQVQFNDAGTFGGDPGFTYNKNTNTLQVENIASGNSSDDTVAVTGNMVVTGNISTTGNLTGEYIVGNGYYITGLVIDVAEYVTQNVQSNITSLGNLVYLNIDGDTISLGDIQTSGDISGSNLSVSSTVYAPNAVFSNKVTIGSNLTVNATAALRIAGNLNAAGSPNISLGTLSNIHIAGGTGGQVLSTDGAGNLYWATGGSGNGGTPGGTNQNVQFNSGGDFAGVSSFNFDVNSSTLQVPSIKSNTTANFLGASSVQLGNVANLHITGGLNGYVLQTDGSGNLSWSAGGGGGNGSVAGSNTQVQFNNNGNFGADAYFTYDNFTRTVQVGGNLIANSFQMGSGVYRWSTSLVYFATTTSTAPQQVLYTVPVNAISGVEFEIIATEPTDFQRQSLKISSLYYNNTVQFTEYGSLSINGQVGNFEVEYNPGDIVTPPSLVLVVSPNTSNPVTYKMLITQYSP